jgi:uncharacterized phage-like protein YoqJ
MKIAVTGHRPEKLGGYDETNPLAVAIKQHMMRTLFWQPIKDLTLISGMALGIDQWWAESAIALNVPFIAAIPFKGMESKWPKSSQDRFNKILSYAKTVEYICDPGYEPWKMQRRNEWMVDNCDEIIAYWNGSLGGTSNCVAYAKKVGKKLTVINPNMIGAKNG